MQKEIGGVEPLNLLSSYPCLISGSTIDRVSNVTTLYDSAAWGLEKADCRDDTGRQYRRIETTAATTFKRVFVRRIYRLRQYYFSE